LREMWNKVVLQEHDCSVCLTPSKHNFMIVKIL